MKPTQKLLALTLILCLLFIACLPDDGDVSNYDKDIERLISLKIEIEALAATSVCNDDSDCKYIAFGSKPCGGPWTYLVYSTSIDTVELETQVQQYNQLESIFNAQYGIASDCAVTQEPLEVICESNKCIAVY